MKRADHLDIKGGSLFQRCLYLSAVLTYNIRQISSRLFQPFMFKINLIGIDIAVQGPESAKSVGAVQDLVICVVCNHALRPVNHGNRCKSQRMLSCIQRISFFYRHGAGIHVKSKELFHHGKCLRISHDLRFRMTEHNFRKGSAVIWLHMVDDHIIKSTAVQHMFQIFDKLVAYRAVHRIKKNCFLIQDHIGVIGNPFRDRINILKQFQASVAGSDPVHILFDFLYAVHY